MITIEYAVLLPFTLLFFWLFSEHLVMWYCEGEWKDFWSDWMTVIIILFGAVAAAKSAVWVLVAVLTAPFAT